MNALDTQQNEQRIGQAADELARILNDAALALMLSLGHRAGLFEALRRTGRVTSGELAQTAELNERYVREWLGAMTVGKIVVHDPESRTYLLPAAHADLLTDGGEANLAAFMQYIPVLAGVEEDVLECFRSGGGVAYARYPRFQAVMEEDSAQTVLGALDDVLELVPGLAGRLDDGIGVLDVGCGRGRAIAELARRYPGSRFTGLDLSAEAVALAEQRSRGLPNVRYLVGDASELGATFPAASFDLVTTFDAVHDQAHPAGVLAGIRQVIREAGVYLAQDIDSSGSHGGDLGHPLGPFLYTISTMHCMTVSLAAGGDGLGTMWGVPAARRLLDAAGFGRVEVHRLPHDEQNVYYVAHPC